MTAVIWNFTNPKKIVEFDIKQVGFVVESDEFYRFQIREAVNINASFKKIYNAIKKPLA
jgi:hypothetical protein